MKKIIPILLFLLAGCSGTTIGDELNFEIAQRNTASKRNYVVEIEESYSIRLDEDWIDYSYFETARLNKWEMGIEYEETF